MKLGKEEREKILSYLNDISGEKYSEYVRSLFESGEDNESLRHFIENDWNEFMRNESVEETGHKALLDSIHHQIRINEFRRNQTLIRKLTSLYARAAAVILIPFLVGTGLLFFGNKMHETNPLSVASIYAPRGSRVAFSLPDGTEGMLNSGSTLEYRIPFSGRRDVTLSGEAWFDVTHDEKHPFRVNAGDLDLTVLGTSFNINAYPEEKYIEVVLKNGSVMVNCDLYTEGIVMMPSERFVLENGKASRSITDPGKYSSWTQGKLVFRSDSMSEVARRIERWYNVNVELMDSELENYSFRATFEDDPLEEVLKFLSMTSPIRYEITPRKILDDTTFARSTVKIYLK